MKDLYLWACLLMFVISCSEEDYELRLAVDPQLLPYFESFEEEALKRQHKVEWNDKKISANFETLDGEIAGQCLKLTDGSHEIRIDADMWSQSSFIEKEFLVFHELGHCYLNRSHDDSQNQQGECQSIMSSGEGNCKKAYNASNRKKMLDELFLNI